MNLSPLPGAGPTGAESIQSAASPASGSAPFSVFLATAATTATVATTPTPAAGESATAAESGLDGKIPETGRAPFRLVSALPIANPHELEVSPIEASDTETGASIGISIELPMIVDLPAPALAQPLVVPTIAADRTTSAGLGADPPPALSLPLAVAADPPLPTPGRNASPAISPDTVDHSQLLPALAQSATAPTRAAAENPAASSQAAPQAAALAQLAPTANPAVLAALTVAAEPRPASRSAGAEFSQTGVLAALGAAHSENRSPASTALPASAFASPASAAGSGNEVNQRAADLSAQLTWQLGNQVNRAEIRLSPPELGSVTVNIEQDGKQLRVEFSAPLAEARQALEESLPRLRELLTAQGHDLVRAQVGGDSQPNKHGAPAPWHRGPGNAVGQDEASSTAETRTVALTSHRGLLDEYA
jgi:flagellar hook-length control protein FliK